MRYQYKAMNKDGQTFGDYLVAESQAIVAEKLKSIGLMVIFIKEAPEETKGPAAFFERFQKVKASELNMFFRQFAVLQKAGVSIILSLESLSEQSVNRKFKELLAKVILDIKQGKNLSGALENHPDTFSALYINIIRAGEEGGTLVDSLEKLADLGEYEEKVRIRILAATRYPIIVMVVITAAFLFLTVLIVPRFEKIYSSSGVSLPMPTLILIGINDAITHYWWLTIVILGIIGFCINRYINTKQGRWYWDSFKLKIPIFGPLMLKIIMGRFAKITGTLMNAGVPILRILDFSSAVVGNVIVAQAIDKIKSEVKEGNRMSGAMKATGLFPVIVNQMVSVGEDTGKVADMLMQVSGYYDGEINFTIENLTSLIEPILIFVLGCGVLLIALGIFLPMWNMMSLFKR